MKKNGRWRVFHGSVDSEVGILIKAVIFDLDDTLYNEIDYVDQAFGEVAKVVHEALLARNGEQVVTSVDSFDRQEAMKAPQNDSVGRQETRKAPQNDSAEGEKEGLTQPSPSIPSISNIHRKMQELLEANGRGRIFNDICEAYGLELSIPELVAVYRSTKPVLHLYPDAEQLLCELEYKKIFTGLITDGCSQVQNAKIDSLKLRQRLGAVLATDDLKTLGEGMHKPNPEVYKYVLNQLGVESQQAMYIGDNPGKDFVGARSLGMKTVRIIRPEGDHMQDVALEGYEAEHTVHTLLEIMDLI